VDEKRTDRRTALRDLAAEQSGEAGPHCGMKRLIAYRQGTLSAAEREAVQEHLSLCPRCTALLLELRDFETAAAGGDAGPESLRQEAWGSLVRRLPAGTPPVRLVASAAARPEARRRRRFQMLAVGAAAVLLLALLGLTLWAAAAVLDERQRLARLEQRLVEREAALAALQRSLAETRRQLDAAAPGQAQDPGRVDELAARVAELTSAIEELRRTAQRPAEAERIAAARELEVAVAPRFILRGQEPSAGEILRAGGVENPVPASSREERFTVALSLADHPSYEEYRLELLDRKSEVLWSGRRPGSALLGDAGTSVSIRGLGPGLYRLRIEGLRPGRTDLLGEYLLRVEPR
jgi:hypothetical protein